MALGGGTWLSQNKKLPGTYINFVSQVRASAEMADRGFGTMPLELDWGPEGKVFTVTAEDFQENSIKIFGYDYTDAKMAGLRDLFMNLKVGYFYRLSNGAVKAECAIAKAVYPGIRGNDITVAITANVDDSDAFDVSTYITVAGVKTVVDVQKAAASWDDVKDNAFVNFIRTEDIELNAGAALSGGSNGSAVTGVQYQAYLDAIEPFNFNCLGYAGTDSTIKGLIVAFIKRLREDVGSKCQAVLYNAENVDYEGIISVKNQVTDDGVSPASLVYWLTGAEAGCAVNASLTNRSYDGEFSINVDYSQSELERALDAGQLIFHNVSYVSSGELVGNINILRDINTFTSFSKSKNEDFSMNQVIRVLDQIAMDVARIFNTTYLGKEQNDQSGREALWGDIVTLHKEYQRIRAIQNFNSDDVPVPSQGDSKNSVVLEYAVQPTVCMEKLYCKVVVA